MCNTNGGKSIDMQWTVDGQGFNFDLDQFTNNIEHVELLTADFGKSCIQLH